MKHFFIALFFTALGFSRVNAQAKFDSTLYEHEFIKLSTGEVVFVNSIEFAEADKWYKADKLLVNGKEYELKRKLFKPYITFYNHEGVLNACYKGIYTPLAKRSGNINFFEPVTISSAKSSHTYYPYCLYLNDIKKINIPHLRKDFTVDNQQAYKTIRKAYRFSAIAFSSLVVPFAGEVNFIVFYFLSRKTMRKALKQLDPTLPLYITGFFRTPLNWKEMREIREMQAKQQLQQ